MEASPNQHYPHFTTYAQHQQHHYDEQRIDDTVDSQRRESFEPAMDDSPAERECDRESLASNGSEISTGALQHIREQMAISLSRMRDLEEQVKLVPLLQVGLNTYITWVVRKFDSKLKVIFPILCGLYRNFSCIIMSDIEGLISKTSFKPLNQSIHYIYQIFLIFFITKYVF